MKICYVQYICPYFESGDNKPPTEHVRAVVPCIKFVNSVCPTPDELKVFFGGTVACNIEERNEKLRRIRDELAETRTEV